jgi:chemotaxis protein CheX
VIETETIKAIVRDVWADGLGLELDDASDAIVSTTYDDLLRATVSIDGGWLGAVSVTCPRGVAAAAAGVLFRSAPDEMNDADVWDALGEVANMTGGGLKALLPGECQLHPPTVMSADTATIAQAAVDSAVLLFGSLPVIVTLTAS